MLKAGIILPGGTAEEQLEQAVLAEESGWDGVFVWEAAYGVDAWTLLGAMAARTRRIRLGTLLTPLPWRRPWKLASQVATLDQLSAGRTILTVGLGAVTDDLPLTGEVMDLPERAALLDEGIDLLRELWAARGSHHGRPMTLSCNSMISSSSAGRFRTAIRYGSSGCGQDRSRCVEFSAATALCRNTKTKAERASLRMPGPSARGSPHTARAPAST